jgi:cephalosporin hydroxylase
MDPIKAFEEERALAISRMAMDDQLRQKSLEWMLHADRYKYSYNFSWLGRPIIKFPTDIVLLQEIIWDVKPDLIIETGIAHGGSLVLSASMLELIGGDGRVVGIDIDIRQHNRQAIQCHPMFKRMVLLEGSSTAPDIVRQVADLAAGKRSILVCLDSLHTHAHVLRELELYAPFVSIGSYLVLPDTFIEWFPKGYYADRPWDVGNNPFTAMQEFLTRTDDFVIDRERAQKLLISEGFDGYLRRVKRSSPAADS